MSIIHRRGPRRTALAIAVVAVTALTLSACDWQKVPIPGDGPLRYRDQIFTSAVITKDITYGSALNQSGQTQDLKLDLYAPPASDTVIARPAIVWIHGGGFFQGDKTSPELVDEATIFAKKGYVNVSINYRLVAGNQCIGTITAACLQGIVDAKHDAQAAVRWLRANAATYGVDPTRIAAAGSSAGAITALNVGYGPEDVGDSGNPGYPSTVTSAVSLSGARILTRANPGEAAALLFHSTGDPLVPFASAQTTVNEATAAGLVVNLTTWDGTGHVPYAAHKTEIIDQTTNFLWWTLGLAEAAS